MMTEVNYILATMTSRSLIIIDELCRSTSVEEGTAIAMAICDDLARSQAYTYVTTHFTLLTKLANLFVNIKVWQMQTIPSGNPNDPKSMKLDYKFNLIPGTTTLRGYGIYMVRNIWPAEVLKHVDELQGQLTKANNDPKFPSIDRRVRLKYDLECKFKKLKLQKKLTIANINKHINDYNNEMAKIGENPHNSQVVLQDMNSAMEEGDRGMDHSIFNASRNLAFECSESETSKIYLNNVQDENNSAFQNVSQSELSSIRPEKEEYDNPGEVVLSPVSDYYSIQTPNTSPSKAKQRMQEIFTPDTNLENLQSQSSYVSVASNQNFELFAPEVNLSCSTSECSLNLTKYALGLEDGSQGRNVVEDQQVTNTQKSFYEEQSYMNLEGSRIFFKRSENSRGPIVSYENSRESSSDLSQQLEMIRAQRRTLTNQQETSYPPPELNTRYSEIESPFTNTFVRPLQGDITKTSTPLITKIKQNARNFESTSTSTSRDPRQSKAQTTTPKISFTILNQVEDIDMHSVQEDLELFVEDVENDENDNANLQVAHHSQPEFSSELNTRYSEIESPYTNTFFRPLQGDITKTSTPLIRKIQHNARNFGSSSTSSHTRIENKTQTTTPKISFTILNQVDDVDMKSVQEDLESFVEDMENEGFYSEENITECKTQDNIKNIIQDYNGQTDKEQEIKRDVATSFKNTSFERSIDKNMPKFKQSHFFPFVKVIEGPNEPSFEEDNCAVLDEETVVQPIVRNPQPNNQEKNESLDVLTKAFNSLSEPKNPVVPQIIKNTDMGEKINGHTDSNSDKLVNIKNDNFEAEHQTTSKSKTSSGKCNKNIENNVEMMIEAFNSLSNPRKVSTKNDEINNSVKDITRHDILQDNVLQTPSDNSPQQENNNNTGGKHSEDNNTSEDAAFESANESCAKETDYKNCNDDQNALKEVKDSSTERYESAKSNSDISYSPLTLSGKFLCDSTKKLAVNAVTVSLQENVCHTTENYEEQLRNVPDSNKKEEKGKMEVMERVKEVIELSDNKEPLGVDDESDNVIETTNIDGESGGCHNDSEAIALSSIDSNNLSKFFTPIQNPNMQETNKSSVTDYDKTTEEFPGFLHKTIEQDGTETEKLFQKHPSEIENDLDSPQEGKNVNKRRSKFYSDLSAKSDSLSNYSDTIVNSVKDGDKKSDVGHNNTSSLQTITKSNTLPDPVDSTSHNNVSASKSKITIISEQVIRINNANSTNISLTDVIETTGVDALKMNTQIGKCEEAAKKQKILKKKTKQMKNKSNEQNIKNKDTKLSLDKPVQQIPYLSAYSSNSSGYSEKQSEASSEDSYLNRNASLKAIKKFSRRPTLGVTRRKNSSKDLKLNKTSKKKTKSRSNDNISTKIAQKRDKGINRDTEKLKIDKNTHELEKITPIDDTGSDKNSNEKPSSENTGDQNSKSRRSSQNEAEYTIHSTRNRAAEEKTITSISEASKLRNLDGDFSSSSSGVRKCCAENALHSPQDCEKRISHDGKEKSTTSLSETSRKRNLDQSSNSTSDKRQSPDNIKETTDEIPATPIGSGETQNQRKKPKIYNKLVTKEAKVPLFVKRASSSFNESSNSLKTVTQDQSQLKFISPSRLSKKAIKEAFFEQDKKFFESSGSSTELVKIWEQRLRRPTVQQIKQSTCLATIRKTEEGVEVIAEKEKKTRKIAKFKGKFLSSRSSSVNMNIFSDKNAEAFDMFIKSNKKDYKSFNFNFGREEASTSRNDGKIFNFKQVSLDPLGYAQDTKGSEEFISTSQNSNINQPFLTQNADFSLTPEGFYKQNRDDICHLVRKYN